MYKKVVRRYVRNTYICTYVIYIDVCILKIWKNMKQVATVWFTLGITKLWQLFVVWKDDNCISIFKRYTGSLLILNTHTHTLKILISHTSTLLGPKRQLSHSEWVSHFGVIGIIIPCQLATSCFPFIHQSASFHPPVGIVSPTTQEALRELALGVALSIAHKILHHRVPIPPG